MPNVIWTSCLRSNVMVMEPTGNIELDKLLLEIKRNVRENAQFLKSLKQEAAPEEPEADDTAEGIGGEPFEEL